MGSCYSVDERTDRSYLAATLYRSRDKIMSGMYNGFMGSMGGLGLLGVLVGLLFFAGIILAIVGLVVWYVRRAADSRGAVESRPRSACELLEERYARGELSREEFLQTREDLVQG